MTPQPLGTRRPELRPRCSTERLALSGSTIKDGCSSRSLLAISPDGPEIHDVKFAGDTKGLDEMTPVKVTKLVASPWSIGDRNGISFRAEQVQPLAKVAA